MKNTLILLAGFPGTGKSYLANILIKQFPDLEVLSPDDIKEEFWDRYGFENLDEKERLITLSWKEYYHRMEQKFQDNRSLISDYPFSEKQRSRLEDLSRKYDYQVVTIRLVGDLDVLFERQKVRDLDDTRHLGHIVNSYHKGMKLRCHDEADNLLEYEEFIRRCTTRGYESFALGDTIEMDVSDFSKVDYTDLLVYLEEKLK